MRSIKIKIICFCREINIAVLGIFHAKARSNFAAPSRGKVDHFTRGKSFHQIFRTLNISQWSFGPAGNFLLFCTYRKYIYRAFNTFYKMHTVGCNVSTVFTLRWLHIRLHLRKSCSSNNN